MVTAGSETLIFKLIVSDGYLTSDPDIVEITVHNVNDPPLCNLAQASPNVLWPPNHKLLTVSISPF